MRDGWQQVTLGEVATVVGGGTPKSNVDSFWGGDIPWITPKDLADRPARYTFEGRRSITEAGLSASAAKMLPKGAVLLTSRAPVGYVSIAGAPLCTNQGFRSLIMGDGQVPEFWYLLLQSSTEYLRANSGGSTFQELSGSALKSLRFTVPPLQVQERIVDLIATLDTTLQKAEAEAETLQRVRRSLVEALLSSERDHERRLADVSSRTIGRTPPRNEPAYWTPDLALPFLTIAGMGADGRVTFSEGVTEKAVADGKAKRVPAGSLLLSFKLTIGRTVITTEDVFPNEAIACIRPNLELITRDFLQIALEAVRWDELGGRAVKGKTLNSTALDEVRVPVPSLAIQDQVVATVGGARDAWYRAVSLVEHLRALRSNLLTVLLSGEHEIPESYDELLEVAS